VLRLVGIHHLLCDHCNLLFTGFVMPGTFRRRKKHRRHKQTTEASALRGDNED
jgi:hypothetical protein